METAESLRKKSDDVGVLYGDVLIRSVQVGYDDVSDVDVLGTQQAGYDYPKVEIFDSSPHIYQAQLLPYYSRSRGIVHRIYPEKSERGHALGAYSALGAGAVTFAGVEMAVASLPYGVVGGLSAFVLANLGFLRRDRSVHRKYLRQLSSDLDDMNEYLLSGETSIVLHNKAVQLVFSETEIQEYGKQMVNVPGHQHTSVSAISVLEWLSAQFDGYEARIEIDKYASTNIRALGPTVNLHASLWDLFVNYKYRVLGGYRRDNHPLEFHQLIPEFERKCGLPFEPAQFPASYLNYLNGKPAPEAATLRDGWRDATVSIVFLPAGVTVRNILKNDANPTELWQFIAPELKLLEANYEQRQELSEQFAQIMARQRAAGVAAEEDEDDLQEIIAKATELQEAYANTLLGVAGLAMLRDKTRRYETARHSLVTSMQESAKATDQFSAIQLFDRAISALVQRLEPDSEEAIRISKELQDYLCSAMPYIDGTERVYKQFYAGMQNKFPVLQLSES